MNKLTLVVLSIVTLTTGCAGMGSRRPSGGAQITKTAPDTSTTTVSADAANFDTRADLGQR